MRAVKVGDEYVKDTEGAYVVEEAEYALLYVENLRTGAYWQSAVVGGADVERILTRSTEPRRLKFKRI